MPDAPDPAETRPSEPEHEPGSEASDDRRTPDAPVRVRDTTGLDAILDEVASNSAPERREVVVGFARTALRRVPSEQLDAADPAQTAHQLIDAFAFADSRPAGELNVRLFTPEVALDGWSEPGTVIQVDTEDRPFLLSTVTEELELRHIDVVRVLHPIIGVERDGQGRLTRILPARTATHRESFLHIELDGVLDEDDAADVEKALRRLLVDVVAATRDFHAMKRRLSDVVGEVRDLDPTKVDPDHAEEVAELLEWLLDDNFVLLGVREYEVVDLPADHPQAPGQAVTIVSGSGLGILSFEETSRYAQPVPLSQLPDDLLTRFRQPEVLTVSRTNRLSTVHRRARMDYVGVKRLDADGQVVGEFRLLGLFTRKGYTEPASTTPVLRRKLQRVLEREDVVEGSHDELTMISLFQALPKDELFQADVDELHETLAGLFDAEEHHATRVVLRTERFTRTVSVVVAVPKDRYSPTLRREMQALLLDRFNGERVDVDVSLGDRADALVRFSLHVPTTDIPDVRTEDLQADIRRLARSWLDDVEQALVHERGEAEGRRLARRYAARLPRAYRDAMPVHRALLDVRALDELVTTEQTLQVHLHPQDRDGIRLVAFRAGDPLELSDFLPILESLGLIVVEEVPYTLQGDGPPLYIHDFGVRDSRGVAIDVDTDGDRLAEATLAGWYGRTETDSLNRLVLRAGLGWREVAVLRAYRRYRQQVGTAYTPGYVNDVLGDEPDAARALVDLFATKFDPDRDAGDDDAAAAREKVLAACDAVEQLDHDRILRALLALIDATLRTNAYRSDAHVVRDGVEIPYLSFKFASAQVPDVPKPVPYREIFVHSPVVEGVHLRGGPVSRGGLRWSDRRDDVRTEVLGLMKAQMLKNAVIVPTGAKGGFVVKDPPADPEALRAAVRDRYVTFVRGLLDVTDNLSGGEVVPPPRVRRLDDDDPYLVVAADKGTATFSDTANAVAEDYGYWLGDAFASGGSRGYDHKALAITARGAWVAVRRHFRELGIDTQSEPISVVGIGDMSGDVFGNGMLSSRTMRLVAAFDHRDIFLDPDPDAGPAFDERKRLFDLPRSSWQDYDTDLISEGGGVFSRSRKRIPLTSQVKEALRVDADELAPAELIQAILQAPVDLLFAGGIGTYVKASTETHAQIGDRTNDELRVDANTLRARVVGEGANLSFTQRARIQYARRGGKINMDAIDNAAGVDISDHEVNVKILLGLAIEDGRIDGDARDELLTNVTETVVAHVLDDVDEQTWRLSQELETSPHHMDAYEQVMVELEERGVLDRQVEALPTSDEMADREAAGAGLTRPELAVLLGYTKRILTADVLDSSLPDQPALQPILASYFPDLLVDRMGDLLADHRLRRELIATVVANDIVNQMGIAFPFQLADEAGAERRRVIAAYWTAREVAAAQETWQGVAELADLLPPERQHEMKREVDRLIGQLTRVYLGRLEPTDLHELIARDEPLFEELAGEMMQLGTEAQRSHRRERAGNLMDDLVEPELATFVACTRDLAMVPDVAAVAVDLADGRKPAAIADAFLRLGSALAVDRLQRVLERLEVEGRWARWQQGGLAGDLRSLLREAVASAFHEEPDMPEPDAVDRFLQRRHRTLDRASTLVGEVETSDPPTLEAVAVAARAVREALDQPR